MKKRLIKKILGFLLIISMMAGQIPEVVFASGEGTTETESLNTDYVTLVKEALQDKYISILGHSVNTYENYSNGTAADTMNSTLRNYAPYYSSTNTPELSVNDTWWMQAVDELGLNLLVNNSFSGSFLSIPVDGSQYGYGRAEAAYVERCVQLHSDVGVNSGKNPDIIAMYITCNDFSAYMGTDTLGTYSSINQSRVNAQTPATVIEAYAIALTKMKAKYPDAEIYCFTSIQRRSGIQPYDFNQEVAAVATAYGAYVVDLYDCVTQASTVGVDYGFGNMMIDGELHPSAKGMDAITNAFAKVFLENSKYIPDEVKSSLHDVTYNFTNGFSEQGSSRVVIDGDSFETSLMSAYDVSVTMGGKNVTAASSTKTDTLTYTISIPYVNGDIVISSPAASNLGPEESLPTGPGDSGGDDSGGDDGGGDDTGDDDTGDDGKRKLTQFRWEYTASQSLPLVNVTTGNNSANNITKMAGTIWNYDIYYAYTNTQLKIEEPIYLNHDQPWSVEWKSLGTWTSTGNLGGAQLLSQSGITATEGNQYFFRGTYAANYIFAFGELKGGQFYNYGLSLADYNHQDTTEFCTYRLTNKIADDGSNMVYLYINDEEIGALNKYYNGFNYVGESNWISGKDFEFSYLGADNFPIDFCVIDYIQVWEKGRPEDQPQVSVDISWGDMDFTYTAGKWVPSAHEYETGTWSADNNSNYIQATNNSTSGISITYKYENADGYNLDADFTDGTNILSGASTLASGEIQKTWLQLSGKLEEEIINQVIGSVTVTID